MKIHPLGSKPLCVDAVIDIAHERTKVTLPADVESKIASIRSGIEKMLVDDAPNTYGVNTGFGALAEVRIPADDLAKLQLNLIRSHATGVGVPYTIPVTRAIMAIRANVLVLGTSGVRPAVPKLLADMLNQGIHPVIPEKGSVGASGDLAPLAHLALVLVGEGTAEYKGTVMSGAEALDRAGLRPVVLQAKEGLALINGTQAMTAEMALVIDAGRCLVKTADIAGAMSCQALLGSLSPFDERIQRVRGHHGQATSAKNLRFLMSDSPITESHKDCDKVQDPYSLRCMPQVHGATRDALLHTASVVSTECNAATDNPLVFETKNGQLDVLSGGNFHGQPIALVADYFGIAVAELANISERRIEQLVNPALSSGLPPFLSAKSGLNSGFMIAQVTAAALVSENKVLAHPASVDSIPSSANREDHVSMGTISARKARQIIEHVETVLAIELLCAAQALDLRAPLVASPAIRAVHKAIRQVVPPLGDDRILHNDITAVRDLLHAGSIVEAAVVGGMTDLE
ncbi:MAG: histidine ammonia-lyase [Myxococcota bacterium]|nr:histidine ammonia-lyase [Myxococcota bacterium]